MEKLKETDPIIHWEKLLELNHENKDSAKKMIELLITTAQQDYLPKLTQYSQEKNYEELSKVAHKICGGSRYCGAIRLEKVGHRLEKAADKKNEKLIRKHLEKMIDEISKVEPAYQKLKDI